MSKVFIVTCIFCNLFGAPYILAQDDSLQHYCSDIFNKDIIQSLIVHKLYSCVDDIDLSLERQYSMGNRNQPLRLIDTTKIMVLGKGLFYTKSFSKFFDLNFSCIVNLRTLKVSILSVWNESICEFNPPSVFRIPRDEYLVGSVIYKHIDIVLLDSFFPSSYEIYRWNAHRKTVYKLNRSSINWVYLHDSESPYGLQCLPHNFFGNLYWVEAPTLSEKYSDYTHYIKGKKILFMFFQFSISERLPFLFAYDRGFETSYPMITFNSLNRTGSLSPNVELLPTCFY